MSASFTYKEEESMEALINLAMKGHYPLFYESWLSDEWFNKKRAQNLSGQERTRAKKLFGLVNGHKRIEHKKTILMAMNTDDRHLFIKAFLKIVEDKLKKEHKNYH